MTGTARRPAFRSTLRFRLILSVAAVHVILMGAFVAMSVHDQSDTIRNELQNRGRSLVALMAVSTADDVLSENLGSLAEVMERIKRQPAVLSAAIVDVRNRVLASTNAAEVGTFAPADPPERIHSGQSSHTLEFEGPIRAAGHTIGTVFLHMTTARMEREISAIRNDGMLMILAALLIGSAAAWALSFTVTRNLHLLTGAAQRVAEGHPDVSVDIRSKDEVGTLAAAFNEMVAALARSAHQVEQEHQKRIRVEQLACAGEFAASIAHEIRNPLTAIVNAVQVLDSDQVGDTERAELRGIVLEESGRLQRILQDFLGFAKMRPPERAPVDLCRLVRQVTSLAQVDARNRSDIQFEVECPDSPVRVTVDGDQIKQVLWNLIRNALEAMPDGGRVRVAVRRGAATGDVEIADTGKGIPQRLLNRIPHPFTTGRRGGTGLGLALAARILMMHGSELHVASEVGQGTTVRFSLPYS